jgi:hypothetical protein
MLPIIFIVAAGLAGWQFADAAPTNLCKKGSVWECTGHADHGDRDRPAPDRGQPGPSGGDDGNNGHGNDPDGNDGSNPGQGGGKGPDKKDCKD